jgi:hypothetical protein
MSRDAFAEPRPAPSPPDADDPDQLAAGPAGLAHVATASFIGSRIVPTGGFAVGLAGGIALARIGQRLGLRAAYGASLAAMLQAVAVMGPVRIGIPLTQSLSAPLLGHMHARRASVAAQLAACASIRLLHQLVAILFYIWVVAGGLKPYAATYDALTGRLPGLPEGVTGALVLTAAGLVAWTVFASIVQVVVYRRALLAWPSAAAARAAPSAVAPKGDDVPVAVPRYDPVAVAVAAAVAFAALLASTDPLVLSAVAAWLALAWLTARADPAPVRAGLTLAAMLAGGALVFGLVGDIGIELTLQRMARVTLLVLVATWLRASAGEDGLREIFRRTLHRVRRVPAMAEASAMLDRLGATGALSASARALAHTVRHVPRRFTPMALAVLGWIATEARQFAVPQRSPQAQLRVRGSDVLLVALCLAAASSLVAAG